MNRGFAAIALAVLLIPSIGPFIPSPAASRPLSPVSEPVFVPHVVTANSSQGSNFFSYDRRLYFVQDLWWIFYSDGQKFVYKTSPDGVVWSQPTTIPSGGFAQSGESFDTWLDGNTIYYVTVPTDVSYPGNFFLYRYGTLNPNGTISWKIFETSVPTKWPTVFTASITVDSSGHIWTAITTLNNSNPAVFVEVYRQSAGIWSRVNIINTPAGNYPIILPLSSGVALVYGADGPSLAYPDTNVYVTTTTDNGATWSAPVSSPSNDYYTAWSSAISRGNTVYFLGSTLNYLLFWSYSLGAHSTSNETIMDQPAESSTISIDANVMVAAYATSSNPGSVYERYSVDYGRHWGPKQTVATNETLTFSSITSSPSGPYGAIWSTSDSNLTHYSMWFYRAFHTTTAVGGSQGTHINSEISLNATVHDLQGNPLSGEPVNFTLGATLGTNGTDSAGVSRLTALTNVSAGTHNATALFTGSPDFLPSLSNMSVTVLPWKLVLESQLPGTPLYSLAGRNYTTDASGTVSILVNMSGQLPLWVRSIDPTTPGTRLVFVRWSNGMSSPSWLLYIQSNTTLSIVTKTQFEVLLFSLYGNPMGQGWYDANSTAYFSVTTPAYQGNMTRNVFSNWSAAGNVISSHPSSSIVVNSPLNLTASWGRQYYLVVKTAYGGANGTGWYDQGATAIFAINETAIAVNSTLTVTFSGWTGAVNSSATFGSVVMNGPRIVTAVWASHFTGPTSSTSTGPASSTSTGTVISSTSTSPAPAASGLPAIALYAVVGAVAVAAVIMIQLLRKRPQAK